MKLWCNRIQRKSRREFRKLVKSLQYEERDGKLEIKARFEHDFDGPYTQMIVSEWVKFLEDYGAANFFSMTLLSAVTGKEYSLIIQRVGGVTPSQRICDLEAENAILRDRIDEFDEENARLRSEVIR